jgi:hypothetical protein
VEKLDLPFPILSDPDRTGAIRPYGVADESDSRNISRPAVILVDPGGEEIWRFVSRDFADRPVDDLVFEALAGLGLAPTSQEPPEPGSPEPGPNAMRLEYLAPYFRGARFALVALSRRRPEVEDETGPYLEMLDRFSSNVVDLYRRKRRAGS